MDSRLVLALESAMFFVVGENLEREREMLGGFTRERVGGWFYTKLGRRGMENTKPDFATPGKRWAHVLSSTSIDK